MFFSSLIATTGLLSLAAAAPTTEVLPRGLTSAACAKPVTGLTTADCQYLASQGFAGMGINAPSGAGTSLATNGPNTWAIKNGGSEPIIVVAWGPQGSWVNAKQPDITYSLAPGQSVTMSTAQGYSGAWAAMYNKQTKLVNGQVSNTWLEFTTGAYGVIDVSREPNMSGNPISATLHGPTGACTANMEKCVFVCNSGNVCTTGYSLLQCAAGSQPGAQTGTYGGAASGGCGGFSATGAHTDVVFS